MELRFLVIGTGSIGARHISNLQSLGYQCGVYSYRQRELPESLSISKDHVHKDLSSNTLKQYDAAVIANETSEHLNVAMSAATGGLHVFLEKPVSNNTKGLEDLKRLIRSKNIVSEVGYMLRCHPNVLFLKKYLGRQSLGKILYVRGLAGHWLPDWRPEVDYRDGYAISKSKGGGVLLDLSHEIDLFNWLLGPIKEVSAMTLKDDLLASETESVVHVLFRFENNIVGQLSLDYLRKDYKREIEVVGEHGTLVWDYRRGTVTLSSSDDKFEVIDKVPENFERNSMFLDHMKNFIARIRDTVSTSVCSLDEAVVTQHILEGIELASYTRRTVSFDGKQGYPYVEDSI
ncbi:Gfo/Idh/MocA family oxidoreductase [Gammaproteobacteria bacterium]|nr:Gfo/Idh/MocA family oxidoreductase [Gammaproteobacteria bacterium]